MQDSIADKDTRKVVTKLIDSWNVGIKEGYLSACGSADKEAVKKHLKSAGITLYLDFNWRTGNTKFIMVKTTPDMIPNPFESDPV